MAKLCATCKKKQSFSFKNKYLKIQDKFYCDGCFIKAKREYLKRKKSFIEEKLVDIHRDLDKFFSAGFLSVIYAGEYFCICNVVDCCYVVIIYDGYKIGNSLLGFAIEAGYLEAIIKDDKAVLTLVQAIPDNDMHNHLINFTDKIFEVMKGKKAHTEKNGPLISKEYEKELIAKYNILTSN